MRGLLSRLDVPWMVTCFAGALALDTLAVILDPRRELTFLLLSLLASLAGAWGGMEAVWWAAGIPPLGRMLIALSRHVTGERQAMESLGRYPTFFDAWRDALRELPWEASPQLRLGLIRLLSGATLSHLALDFIDRRWGLGLWPWLGRLVEWEAQRLLPLTVAAAFLAPAVLLLVGRRQPAGPLDALGTALASGLSLLATWSLYQRLQPVTPEAFAAVWASLVLDLPALLFGLMVGGVFWWPLLQIGNYMAPRR